jgi:2-dehydro-3-deoxyphosphogluconate aldolase/(4S)-4-hydroxy-2-oxoglutarate aldolase
MDKEDTLNRLKEAGLVAVIRGPSPELTMKTVAALVQGGVTGIEITYSTPEAEQVVRNLDEQFGERILLGMGTLTQSHQAFQAKKAGAKFIVSPICDEELSQAMVATGLAVMIGAFTPTEVFRAHRLNSDIVKLFPGSAVGPGYVKALKGPFPEIELMPTGGVNAENISAWFEAGVFAVGAGSELCPNSLIKAGKFDEITRIASKFVEIVNRSKM